MYGLKIVVPLTRRNVEIKTRHTKADFSTKVPTLSTPRSSRYACTFLYQIPCFARFYIGQEKEAKGVSRFLDNPNTKAHGRS